MRPMSEILSDALASFEGGKRWTHGTLWRDAEGNATAVDSPVSAETADTFCAYGAIYRSMHNHGEIDIASEQQQVNVVGWVEKLLPKPPGWYVTSVNDQAETFEPVKKMFCGGVKRALMIEESGASINSLKTGYDVTTNQPVDYIEAPPDDPTT